MIDCCTCAWAEGCLFTVRECIYECREATKEQVINRLNKGEYKNYRETMKEYLLDKFGIVYNDNGSICKITKNYRPFALEKVGGD